MAKRNANKKMIILSNPELGDLPFEHDHAERILAHDARKKQTNWTLHDDKLTFEDGKIITK